MWINETSITLVLHLKYSHIKVSKIQLFNASFGNGTNAFGFLPIFFKSTIIFYEIIFEFGYNLTLTTKQSTYIKF